MTLHSVDSAAGTGRSASVTGNDRVGVIQLNTGTGTSNGLVMTLQMTAQSQGSPVFVRLYPLDATTVGLTTTAQALNGLAGGIEIDTTAGIADSTTYNWAYEIF